MRPPGDRAPSMSTIATRPTDAPPADGTPAPVAIEPGIELPPDGVGYRLKRRLLGPPLHTEQLEHERLGKPTALAVFASDNLSSSAYATEEILRVLVPAVGVAAFSLVVPITVAMLVVLAVLILSYRQTIKAYPTAGGAYMVTRDNFGLLPAQVAGVALLTDYVLTVAVSVAAGTAALVSAFSALTPYTVPISVAFICLIAYGNLRGVKESGRHVRDAHLLLHRQHGAAARPRPRSHALRRPPARRARPGGSARLRQPGRRPAHGRVAVRRPARLRLRRRRGHRRRGDLQRRARVPQARVAERPHHPRDHGQPARRHVPRPVDPRRPHEGRAVRRGHADGHLPDRRARLRRQPARPGALLRAAGRHDAHPGPGRQHQLRRLPPARQLPRRRQLHAPPAHQAGPPPGVLQRHHLPGRLRHPPRHRHRRQGRPAHPALRHRRVHLVHALPGRAWPRHHLTRAGSPAGAAAW